MSDRALARIGWIVMSFVGLSFVAAGILEWINDPLPSAEWGRKGIEFFFVGMIFTFPLVGALIVSRHPRNSIGWIMLGIGLVAGITGVLDGYVRYGLVTTPGSLPHADLVLSFLAGSWVLMIGPIGTFLVLLFPDGRVPSPRWRPVAYLAAAGILSVYLLITITPGEFGESGYPGVHNPIGVEALRPFLDPLFSVLVLIPLAMIASAAALIHRFGRSRGQERLQLKWFVAAASIVAGIYAATMASSLLTDILSPRQPAWVLWLQDASILSFGLIPIAIGIAILRHRLYNIDRLINRTLVYTALTGILTLAYLLLVAALQSVIRPVTADSKITVAISTLAVAALFRPLRSRVQGFIDRRFYRKKYDAAQTLESFASTMRNEVDLASLSPALIGVVRDAMQPAHVSLWLRPSATNKP